MILKVQLTFSKTEKFAKYYIIINKNISMHYESLTLIVFSGRLSSAASSHRLGLEI